MSSSRIPSGHVSTFRFGSATVDVTATRDAAVADAWVRALRASHPRGRRLVVGLDCKWNQRPPTAAAWMAPRVALLQLCAGSGCLVLQLLHAHRVPEAVRGFLGDPEVRLVGVGVGDGAARLAADHGLVCAALEDLEGPCCEFLGLVGGRRLGLKGYAKEILGLNMEKPISVALSDWEKYHLDMAQIKYACVDAYVSYMLGQKVLDN
ncbi:hypothetical protein ACP70R_031485 [Stipagrostis hirtigluma subsp. patula]